MTTKRLNIEDNIFELTEDTMIRYWVYFATPFIGGSKILVPAL